MGHIHLRTNEGFELFVAANEWFFQFRQQIIDKAKFNIPEPAAEIGPPPNSCQFGCVP